MTVKDTKNFLTNSYIASEIKKRMLVALEKSLAILFKNYEYFNESEMQ